MATIRAVSSSNAILGFSKCMLFVLVSMFNPQPLYIKMQKYTTSYLKFLSVSNYLCLLMPRPTCRGFFLKSQAFLHPSNSDNSRRSLEFCPGSCQCVTCDSPGRQDSTTALPLTTAGNSTVPEISSHRRQPSTDNSRQNSWYFSLALSSSDIVDLVCIESPSLLSDSNCS